MYWENAGPENTGSTIEAALERARELKVKHLVVASNSGATAEMLSGKGGKFNITCVTHHVGFTEPGKHEMSATMRAKLEEKGVRLLTTTHLLAGLDRALRMEFQGIYPAEIVASSLRLFGQGVKVCIEISVMALDAGLIPYGEEIIAIAGSNQGADTACVIVPAHSNNFFDTAVKEVICKPREK